MYTKYMSVYIYIYVYIYISLLGIEIYIYKYIYLSGAQTVPKLLPTPSFKMINRAVGT